MIANLILLWILLGFLATLLSLGTRLRWEARVLFFVLSPYFFWIEGTPKMEEFLRWARTP